MQPLAVLSALGRQFIEQNERLQNCKEGAFSTARASEIHEARTALFSALVSFGLLVTSMGECRSPLHKVPQTIGWLKKLELWIISILRNQASRP